MCAYLKTWWVREERHSRRVPVVYHAWIASTKHARVWNCGHVSVNMQAIRNLANIEHLGTHKRSFN